MTFYEFSIGTDDVDRRIDRIIRKFLKTVPLSVVYKNLRSGFIRVNGKKIKNDYRMLANDILFIEKNFYDKSEKVDIKSSSERKSILNTIHYDTVFENNYIKIINKPYGINVQSSSASDVSLDTHIKAEYEKRIRTGLVEESLSFAPGPLHRLDKQTTGLLAFSQNLQGARYFSEAISSHRITKQYLCILSGTLENEAVWEHAIEKNNDDKKNGFSTVTVHDVHKSSDKAKYAKSFVSSLDVGTYNGEPVTLVKIRIETGRTHQIRSQAAYSGFPLLGDTAYGYSGKCDSIFLHAWILEFPNDNPLDIPTTLCAEIPKSFKNFLVNHLCQSTIPSYN